MTANGQIDPGTLTPVRSQPYLRLTAATEAAFAALRAAVYAAYGWWLTLTDAYRDYATQERIFRERYTTTYLPGRPRKFWLGRWWYLKQGYATAAVPGTSNHGWGTTVDAANLGGFGGEKYHQLAAVAPYYGWSNAEGAAIGEAWHWNHVGGTTPVSNPASGGGTATPTAPSPTAPTPIARLLEGPMLVRVRTATGGVYLTNLDPARPVFRLLNAEQNSLYERLDVPLVWNGMSTFERDQVRQTVRDLAKYGIDS